MPGRRGGAGAAAGAHFLVDPWIIARLTTAAALGPGDLVLDLGAGYGALTAPLSRTGALVVAVERDRQLAARLRRRFRGNPAVRVVEADLRAMSLPGRRFRVVSNPPFALTTYLCRRLLGAGGVPLAGADLVLGLGQALRLTAVRPPDAESAWWAARYQARLVCRAAPGCFSPSPARPAAVVSVRPRPGAGLAASQRALRPLIRAAYRRPRAPLAVVARPLAAPSGAVIRRALIGAGADPGIPASELTGEQWALVGARLTGR